LINAVFSPQWLNGGMVQVPDRVSVELTALMTVLPFTG
jgi:hypothetical protein